MILRIFHGYAIIHTARSPDIALMALYGKIGDVTVTNIVCADIDEKSDSCTKINGHCLDRDPEVSMSLLNWTISHHQSKSNILWNVTHSITSWFYRFSEAMQSYTLLGAQTATAVPTSTYSLASTGKNQPPLILMQYPPLAVYCNQIVTALNDLRLCAPLSLGCKVANTLHLSLAGAAQVLLAYHR